ncbi:MAG: hypothetical protein ABIH25_04150 [Candidatus Woesearchaeota archaeon]
MANEELIGFHKGCINTLAGERTALVNMVNDVDKLIQMHMEELRKLGVDVDAMVKQGQEDMQGQQRQQSTSQPKLEEQIEPQTFTNIEPYEQEERIP